jgi:hypothetical protein
MTKDDIIRMAREADFCVNEDGEISTSNSYGIIRGELERFAALVAASEREACAKLCDEAAKDWERYDWDDDADEKYGHKESACEECAETIRARSQK